MPLYYALLASDPQNIHHACFWATAHGPCNKAVLGSEFAEHLRSCHDITVADGVQLNCLWSGCSTELKKESLMRHIQEKHLEWRYACPVCGERFTRNYTRQNHLRRHEANYLVCELHCWCALPQHCLTLSLEACPSYTPRPHQDRDARILPMLIIFHGTPRFLVY
ncbi:hypothetical protein JVU11DRAFT_4279 [Chiua virens]|nr:hypothetical protein JVU11DRAFT_4279 [Chiua virens]